MAKLDHIKLTAVYMSIRHMEFSIAGSAVRGGIKHTKELRVFSFKKAMHSSDAYEWHKEIRKEMELFDKYGALTSAPSSLIPKVQKCSLLLGHSR